MALHMQQQVLDALAALLAAGATVADTRVHLDRLDALPASALPAILIEEGDNGEEVSPQTIHGHEQRTLEVIVRCVLQRGKTSAAQARAFGLEVEKLIAASPALSALCALGVALASSRLRQEADAEFPYAERVLTWRFSYFVLSTAPDVAA